MLNEVKWCTEVDNVQECWNDIEMKLVKVIDVIVPIMPFNNNNISSPVPANIKSKINKRNRLLKMRKRHSTNELKLHINCLNYIYIYIFWQTYLIHAVSRSEVIVVISG